MKSRTLAPRLRPALLQTLSESTNRSPVSSDLKKLSSEQIPSLAEPFFSIKDAAEVLGLKPWWLWRAVKQGIVPSYTFLTGRRLVRLSDVVSCIERTRSGGTR